MATKPRLTETTPAKPKRARPLSMSDLPATDTVRWVPRRKKLVVQAVEEGLISAEDACSRYALTPEEFGAWQRSYDSYGLQGLRVTRLNDFR
ncbi:MAG: DUF1153 domain-containing protein [Geminicoccaceae bacterium]